MSGSMRYGIVISAGGGGKLGLILADDSQERRFVPVDGQELGPKAPVSFVDDFGLGSPPLAADVRLVTDIQTFDGRVVHVVEGSFMIVGLRNKRQVYVAGQLIRDRSYQRGEVVRCASVPGKIKGRDFALTIEPAAAVPTAKPPEIGVSTRRGASRDKSVNEDAFLVHPLDGQRSTWVVAVADGVSRSPQAWWASDRCMQVIYRTAGRYGLRVASGGGKLLMREWMNTLREEFHHDRGTAPTEYRESTSTVMLAVVRGRQVVWGSSGDSRIYELGQDPTSNQPKLWVRNNPRLATQMLQGRKVLVQHVGVGSNSWSPKVGAFDLGLSNLLLLSSDGVTAHDDRMPKSRQLMELAKASELQPAVEGVTTAIAQLGETDDLTLVVVRPTR